MKVRITETTYIDNYTMVVPGEVKNLKKDLAMELINQGFAISLESPKKPKKEETPLEPEE